MKHKWQSPLFFERNRVGRVYTGGALFAELFGDAPQDGFFPEEWIASSVEALNESSQGEREGVSRLRGEGIFLDDLLKEAPEEYLGPQGKLRILVKGLDSAIRLPAQVHPDKAFSRKYFHSEYGKTECWLVLGKRPGAKIYFGFRPGVTLGDLENAVVRSEEDPTAMEGLLEWIEPEVGGVYLVPARTVHAIGAGCLILEVQEPTDFTIQPERYCGDYRLSDREMYLGLPKETALSCFDLARAPEPGVTPRLISCREGVRQEVLIDEAQTDCFVIHRYQLSGGRVMLNVADSYGIYIVTEGEGELSALGGEERYALKKGDYFLLPFGAMGKYTVSGNLTLVECY